MMIYRLSYGKFAILNIFAQIVCVFPTYDDAFDYLKAIEF